MNAASKARQGTNARHCERPQACRLGSYTPRALIPWLSKPVQRTLFFQSEYVPMRLGHSSIHYLLEDLMKTIPDLKKTTLYGYLNDLFKELETEFDPKVTKERINRAYRRVMKAIFTLYVPEEERAIDVARAWLQEYFTDFQEPSAREVIQKAVARGISKGTLIRAKALLPIRSDKSYGWWRWVWKGVNQPRRIATASTEEDRESPQTLNEEGSNARSSN